MLIMKVKTEKKRIDRIRDIIKEDTKEKTDIIERLKNIYKSKIDDTIICYGDTLANLNLKKYFNLVRKNYNKIIITVYKPELKFGIF